MKRCERVKRTYLSIYLNFFQLSLPLLLTHSSRHIFLGKVSIVDGRIKESEAADLWFAKFPRFSQNM